ncbi:DUF362 domain-containing protein [bacterium]|nr:MAG: DUF362 domain-containing protein [bacterium]
MTYPTLHPLRDLRENRGLEDIAATTAAALEACGLGARIVPGARIAITAGSRGITDIAGVLRAVAAFVRARGGEPFVIPAMGSHGGGTAEGQVTILRELGITETSIATQIHAQMDVVDIGTAGGIPVVCDALAAAADGIIIVARVKPHTDFTGTIESGILKMSAIGLGKAAGAKIYHSAFARDGYERVIRAVSAVALERLTILAGVAIVEDNRGRTHTIEASAAPDVVAMEERLLCLARELMSTLPFPELDLLIVDEMGKNVSGTGMDTNVTGRATDGRSQKVPTPLVKRLFVRDLTEASHGNATGIGLADFCSQRLADKIDWQATYLNALTAAQPAAARLPIVCPNDRFAVDNALVAAGIEDGAAARIARIHNTLHMEAIYASPAALRDVTDRERYAAGDECDALTFDQDSNLLPL